MLIKERAIIQEIISVKPLVKDFTGCQAFETAYAILNVKGLC
jgi:hypothetical protein